MLCVYLDIHYTLEEPQKSLRTGFDLLWCCQQYSRHESGADSTTPADWLYRPIMWSFVHLGQIRIYFEKRCTSAYMDRYLSIFGQLLPMYIPRRKGEDESKSCLTLPMTSENVVDVVVGGVEGKGTGTDSRMCISAVQ